MREHKFRVWDVKHKCFVSWDVSIDKDGKFRYDNEGYGMSFCDDCGDDLVAQQYTGFKDQNGKEVYEGDIIEAWSAGHKGRFEVWWREEGNPQWIMYPAWQNDQFWYFSVSRGVDIAMKVIGNIFENPELITWKRHK